jgi:SAM-dependent methyltransferase
MSKGLDLSERLTIWLRFILDDCLPPVLRDRRWFFLPLVRLYAPRLDVDFKVKAPEMTDEEFRQAYERRYPTEFSAMTPRTTAFVVDRLVGDSVLEVGCGGGEISMACARTGRRVMATDIAQGNLDALAARVKGESRIETRQADLQRLPFDDRSYDTTVCLHVLEHVRDLPGAIAELKRVTRRRLLIIVPRERYHRYTANYHLTFFGGPEQLLLALKIPGAECRVIDNSLCFAGDMEAE